MQQSDVEKLVYQRLIKRVSYLPIPVATAPEYEASAEKEL